MGPQRVIPGKLAISRTFGDIHAKLQQYGGKPGVVIATPEVKIFRVQNECDFIVIATDGVYDRLENNEVI